jgi:hypothetical protein
VQPARHRVPAGVAAKLAARVQHGEHRLQGRLAGDGVQVGGDAAAVVAHADPARGEVELDVHVARVAALHLVDRVVQDLVHQVVQPALARAADVHAGPLAHGVQPLQDLDLGGVVGGGGRRRRRRRRRRRLLVRGGREGGGGRGGGGAEAAALGRRPGREGAPGPGAYSGGRAGRV